METKRGRPHEFKLDEQGAVLVAFAQLDVVDHDGDVTLPGAFPAGKEVPMSAYGHTSWDGALPIGRGKLAEADGWATFAGRFLMETDQGRNGYHTVKAMADLQEWSYGYLPVTAEYADRDGQHVRILKQLEVYEVSPVLVGAGIGTHTLDIKTARSKAAIAPHGTATSDAAWDGPANEARLPNTAAALAGSHAWRDPDGDPEAKASYRFIHHEVSAAGDVGAANLIASSTGIGILNGGRGGTTIPDADREGVWRHLARHLRDGDREPPELRAFLPDGEVFAEHVERVLADVAAMGSRADALAAIRRKEGRVLSSANVDRLTALVTALDEAAQNLRQLLADAEPAKAREARQLAILIEHCRLAGVPIL